MSQNSKIYSLPTGLCCTRDHDYIQISKFITKGEKIFCQCNIPFPYINNYIKKDREINESETDESSETDEYSIDKSKLSEQFQAKKYYKKKQHILDMHRKGKMI